MNVLKRDMPSAAALLGAVVTMVATLHGSDAAPERAQSTPAQAPAGVASFAKLPLSFEPNQGQAEPGAKFISRDTGYTLSLNAGEAVLSLRRGVAVQSRVQLGKPKDLQTSRLMNSTAHWVFQTRNPADDRKRRVYRWTFLPLLVVDKVLQQLPALQRPTISSLSDEEWVAVNTIIEERTVRDLIPKLKAAGGQGIVEYPLNKIVL